MADNCDFPALHQASAGGMAALGPRLSAGVNLRYFELATRTELTFLNKAYMTPGAWTGFVSLMVAVTLCPVAIGRG